MALQARRTKMNANKIKLQSPLLDSDNYPGRLVQVIDCGLQQNFFDQDKINHEVMLTYELDGEFCLDENDQPVTDKPRWFSETINMINLPEGMSLNDIYNDQFRGKAKMVTRSRAFDPKGELDFDFSQMVDSPCAITIIQKKKKDGTMKNEVGGVTAPMRGMQVAPLINPPKVFALDAPDMEVYGSLPDWLKEKIAGNLEHKGSPLEALLNGGQSPAPKQEPKPEPKVEAPIVDEELPW